MASKKDVLQKISDALNAKAGGQRPCSICGQIKWALADKFSVVVVANHPGQVTLGGKSMPLIPVVCNNCGNTHFVNIRVLGFTDMDAMKIDEDAPSKS